MVANLMIKKCDGCGRLRVNDTNHWLVGWCSDSHGRVLGVAPMDEQVLQEVGEKPSAKVFCGENCATKWFATEGLEQLWR
jgi:hypothetical protein